MTSRGDVVLVDFPYSDRTGSKLRPALVIQTDSLNASRHDTILAGISRTRRFPATEVAIDIATVDGKKSGLLHNSVIDCDLLGTFDQKLIQQALGTLPPSLMQEVDAKPRVALGL